MLVAGPSAPCSGLVPDSWEGGVESADFPTQAELELGDAVIGARLRAMAGGIPSPTDLAWVVDTAREPWQRFGLRQTGQLDKANERTADALSIVRKCEARDAQAAEAVAGRSAWQRLTPWRE